MGNLVLNVIEQISKQELSRSPIPSITGVHSESESVGSLYSKTFGATNGSHSNKAPNIYLPLPCRLYISNIIYKHYLNSINN